MRAGTVGADPPQQVRAGLGGLAPQRDTRRTRGRRAAAFPALESGSSSSASLASDPCKAPTRAAKMACVPHSANATTRACGNADCSPLFTPGRPKIRRRSPRCRPHPDTSRRPRPAAAPPATHPACLPRPPIGRATRSNNACNGSDPNRARAWKIADFARQQYPAPPARRPRQPVGQLGQHILIGALGVQRHPDREIRHHPRRQRPTAAARSAPTPRSPHQPDSGGNTRVNTPTDTRSDNRRSDSGFTHPRTRHTPQTTPM